MSAKRARSESKIVEYLRSGHILAGIMEWLPDCFDGTPFDGGAGAASPLTDGVWRWRQDLAHYVERYHVALPDDFVVRMVDVGSRVPDLSSQDLAALEEAEKRGRGDDWWASP